MHTSFCVDICFHLDETAGSCGNSMFNCLRNCQFSKVCTILAFYHQSQSMRIPTLLLFCQHLFLSDVLILPILLHVKWYPLWFWFDFPDSRHLSCVNWSFVPFPWRSACFYPLPISVVLLTFWLDIFGWPSSSLLQSSTLTLFVQKLISYILNFQLTVCTWLQHL